MHKLNYLKYLKNGMTRKKNRDQVLKKRNAITDYVVKQALLV